MEEFIRSGHAQAAAQTGASRVISPGALDMVNFGPPETIPRRFARRRFHRHNPNVTLMRTSPEECSELGHILANKLNAATAPVAVIVPLRGVSQLSTAGQPFYDPIADAALFESLLRYLDTRVLVKHLDTHINDMQVSTAFADIIENWLAEGQEPQ
jgi:uncharacterized protein (UPF0261 family)